MSTEQRHPSRAGRPGSPPDLPVVLYVGGSGRSGSTLLDRLLGQVPGVFSSGELARLWDSGLHDNQLCGCGEPFLDCPFWTQVGQVAVGGWDRLDADHLVDLQKRVRRHRYLPLIVAPWLSRAFRARLREYEQLTLALYSGIYVVSGCDVIVDSTKEASYAYLLRRMLGPRLRVAHLIRYSAGVAYSWTKHVKMPDRSDTEVHLPRYHPGRMAVRWVIYNALFDLLAATGVPTTVVHYEDLVEQPEPALRKLLQRAGLENADLSFIQDGHVRLVPGHTVAGNPMRFKEGRLELRPDDAWRRSMPRRHQLVVQALSSPGLLRYGYLGRRAHRED